MSLSPPQYPDVVVVFDPVTGAIIGAARGIAGPSPGLVTVVTPGTHWRVLLAPQTASPDVDFYVWHGWTAPLANPIAAPADALSFVFDSTPPGDNTQLDIQCVDGAGVLGVAATQVVIAGWRLPAS